MNRLELKAWRKARHVRQVDLARLLHIDQSSISRWESGESTVPGFLNLALDQLDSLHYWSPEGIDALPRLEKVS
jgi:transcriptional regulator with XRE-family HTH domain